MENLRKSQRSLKRALVEELAALGYEDVKNSGGFVYAVGNLPVMLVAHLDTVHQHQVETSCYSRNRQIMMSPEGIGGDDRAGVYMILRILREHRCHVLFCEDEEIGGHGARVFANSRIRPEINYIVEMDRRGTNDAVFYNCDNTEFTDVICGFGFEKAHGSFSDISVIGPHLGIAAVNISAGYFNEHCRHESIDLVAVEHNIVRISGMVRTPSPPFEYIERGHYVNNWHQVAFEDLDMFDYISGEGAKEEIRKLMPLPNSAVLKHGGQLLDSCGWHMPDARGNSYHYISDLDAAVLSENCKAASSDGQPLKYEVGQAQTVIVIPMETALEELGIK